MGKHQNQGHRLLMVLKPNQRKRELPRRSQKVEKKPKARLKVRKELSQEPKQPSQNTERRVMLMKLLEKKETLQRMVKKPRKVTNQRSQSKT